MTLTVVSALDTTYVCTKLRCTDSERDQITLSGISHVDNKVKDLRALNRSESILIINSPRACSIDIKHNV